MGGGKVLVVTWDEVVERYGVEYQVADNPTGGLRRRAMKACFRNALNTAMDHGLGYCEGYAFDGANPIQHAWNLDDHGKVVDLTWRSPGTRYVGVAIDWRLVAQVASDSGEFGPALGNPLVAEAVSAIADTGAGARVHHVRPDQGAM